eukprot:scaffold290982_cov28-Tisochrysis_lutea.AAC.1
MPPPAQPGTYSNAKGRPVSYRVLDAVTPSSKGVNKEEPAFQNVETEIYLESMLHESPKP